MGFPCFQAVTLTRGIATGRFSFWDALPKIFPLPIISCRCPDGFTGTLCDQALNLLFKHFALFSSLPSQVMPGYGADCGGRLEVGQGWARIASPNYPAEFHEGQECSWLLVAPPGQRVQL